MTHALTRTAARATASGLAATVATLYGQTRYVAHLDLPDHPDLDAGGPIGSGDTRVLDVVVLGDSACTGPGLDHADQIWIRQLLARFDDRAFAVESFAVGGATTSDVDDTQLPAALLGPRDLAVVSVGANDALHGHGVLGLERRLGHVVHALLSVAHAVVLTGVGDVGTAPRIPFPLSTAATAVARNADRAHRRVAQARSRVHKVPMWERTTAHFRTRDDVWSTDRYHPNAAGHGLWADAAEDTFARALAEIDRHRSAAQRSALASG